MNAVVRGFEMARRYYRLNLPFTMYFLYPLPKSINTENVAIVQDIKLLSLVKLFAASCLCQFGIKSVIFRFAC